MKICVINGVNLNKLGFRAPEIYGNESLDEIAEELKSRFPRVEFEFKTSNIEGEIVTFIQKASEVTKDENGNSAIPADGIIINAGGYSHYSIAIRDAIADTKLPVVEVHLSNIFAREVFRRNSVISPVAKGVISGFGKNSYVLAVTATIDILADAYRQAELERLEKEVNAQKAEAAPETEQGE